MEWTWDKEKAEINRTKHGISFETAICVFDDPFAVSLLDNYPFEVRYRTIGRPSALSAITIIVVHTWHDDEYGRVISAREASKSERRIYEDGTRKN